MWGFRVGLKIGNWLKLFLWEAVILQVPPLKLKAQWPSLPGHRQKTEVYPLESWNRKSLEFGTQAGQGIGIEGSIFCNQGFKSNMSTESDTHSSHLIFLLALPNARLEIGGFEQWDVEIPSWNRSLLSYLWWDSPVNRSIPHTALISFLVLLFIKYEWIASDHQTFD